MNSGALNNNKERMSLKFSAPTNWQWDLIQSLPVNGIDEIFGKLQDDPIGGLRNSYSLPYLSRKEAARYIQEIHRKDIKFNYILNSICLNNYEWTRSGQGKIRDFLSWLTDIGVDAVTVSIPYLLQIIKKNYPDLMVTVSTAAAVHTIERAKYWESIGADEITLNSVDVNRSFILLKRIKDAIKCKIRLIANECCLYQCPLRMYHCAIGSHGTQSQHFLKGFSIDYATLACNYRKLLSPLELIRSPWIRPEDLKYYEEIGIDRIKLVDRVMSTDAILLIIKSYLARRYDGNLMDLFPSVTKYLMYEKSNIYHKLRYFIRPFSVNVFKLAKAAALIRPHIYIDNRALDNFILHFLNNDCSTVSCLECGYCQNVADKVVSIDKSLQESAGEKYKVYLDGLISGDMFSYRRQ